MFVEKTDDLRARPRRGIHRHADDPRDRRATRPKDNNRFSAIVLGRREEPAVPDARQGATNAYGEHQLGERTMFLTKKHIPRRTFLRGAGVTLALPLLESMVPAFTPLRLTAAAPVRRFVGIWHPHGASPGYWSPTAGRPGLRVLVHHQAARAVPQPRRADHRPRHAGGDGDRRGAGRRSRARRGAAVGRAAAAQRRQPVPRRRRSIR